MTKADPDSLHHLNAITTTTAPKWNGTAPMQQAFKPHIQPDERRERHDRTTAVHPHQPKVSDESPAFFINPVRRRRSRRG
jgi:hypothetical protein